MWVETHRCSVPGCPNLAAYEVVHYDFDVAEGALVYEPDDGCPTICVEHAIDNERRAVGDRRPGGLVEYPYTNQSRTRGLTVYRRLQLHYANELS